MKSAGKISPFQLFGVLYISTVFSAMMYSSYTIENADLLTLSLSGLVSVPCLLIISVPLILYLHRCSGMNIITAVHVKKPMLGGIFTAVYILYFAFSSILSLTVFALLLSGFVNSGISFVVFFTVAILIAYYAAFKGITAIGRSSIIFLVFTVLSLVFICVSLAVKIDTHNYSQIFLLNANNTTSNLFLIMAQSSPLPAVFLLADKIKGNCRKPIILWIILSGITVFIIGIISYGVIGGYMSLTPFPFYTAVQLTEIGAFRRLDVVFTALWTVGMFVSTSLSMYALRQTLQHSFTAEKTKYLNPAAAIIIGVVSLLVVSLDSLKEYIYNVGIIFVVFIIAAFVFPITVVLLYSGKKVKTTRVKAAVAVILALTVVPLLAGCDSVQLDERLLIKGVGIDLFDGEYSVTVQYISGDSEDMQSCETLTVTGSTVSEAMGGIKKSTGREPFLGQNTAIIIGSMASSEVLGTSGGTSSVQSDTASSGVKSLLDYYVRYCDSRPTVKLFISETTAQDILTFDSGGIIVPIEEISELTYADDSENLFTLLNFMNLETDIMDTPTAATLRIDGDSVSLGTAAVFPLNGTPYLLDEEQLDVYLLVNGIAEGEVFTLNDVSCEVLQCTAAVTAENEDGKLVFTVNVKLTLDILENAVGMSADDTEKLFSNNLTAMTEECLDVTLHEKKCDIYSLGKNLRFGDYSSYSTSEEYEQGLSDCIINASVNCEVSQSE